MAAETGAPRGREFEIRDGDVIAIEAPVDDIRVRGVDGNVARILAPSDLDKLITEETPGRLSVRAGKSGPGFVFGIRLGGRGFIGAGSSGTIEMEVPRTVALEIGTTTGDVVVRDVLGGVSIRSTSGDANLHGVGGSILFHAATGDLEAVAAGPIRLEAETMSGDVEVAAPLVRELRVRTVSGDVEVATTLDPEGHHAIECTSGDVRLALHGGASIEVRTVSGEVDVAHPDGRRRGRGEPIVIGDGAARISVRTLSGDIDILRGRAAPFVPAAPLPPTPPRPPAVPVPPAPPVPSAPPLPPAPPAPAFAPAADAPTIRVSPPAPVADPMTVILETLARGEIDVDEAERRIAAVSARSGSDV